MNNSEDSLKSGCTAVIIGLCIMFFFAMQRGACEENRKNEEREKLQVDPWNRDGHDRNVEPSKDR
jgi:hypothetical protein